MTRHPGWTGRALPWCIGAFFGYWCLRNLADSGTIHNDAGLHATNGAFLLDWLRHGPLLHPSQAATAYYARFPALSIPYHPPLFPLAEALLFGIFGVAVWPARALVAMCLGVCAWLLFRTVKSTHGSASLAAAVTVTFLALPVSQSTGSDVMLEFPALTWTLAAVAPLARSGDCVPWSFGLCAALAVLTKQNTIFLAGVPLLHALITKPRRVWQERALLASPVLPAASLAFLWLMSRVSGLYVENVEWPVLPLPALVAQNAAFYAGALSGQVSYGGAALLTGLALFALPWRRNRLYTAWTAAVLATILVTPPQDVRYLFFALPALLVLAFDSFRTAVSRLLHPGWARFSEICVALLAAVPLCLEPAPRLSGPGEAAAALPAGARVLYAGRNVNAFTFEMRRRNPALSCIVIRASDAGPDNLLPVAFEGLARDYDLGYVVVERTPFRESGGAYEPPASAKLAASIAMNASLPADRGRLEVYRLAPASRGRLPKDLTVRMVSGRGLEVSIPR